MTTVAEVGRKVKHTQTQYHDGQRVVAVGIYGRTRILTLANGTQVVVRDE